MPALTEDVILNLVEPCSGLGALGVGASYAGWKSILVNDVQASILQLAGDYSEATQVLGDIADDETWNLHPRRSSMGFGFACQPFSKLGDQRGGQDDRSKSLTGGLRAAWLMHCPVIVMECVADAASSSFVRKEIQKFVQSTGYNQSDQSDQILELSSMWPCARRRWWMVLTAGFMGKVTVPEMPALPQGPTLCDLFPHPVELTDEHKKQLTLTKVEEGMFRQYGPGPQAYVLDMNSPMPTALHSWGNQCFKCSCGCRPEFSHNRLLKKGIRGVLVLQAVEDGGSAFRHASPIEASIANGLPVIGGKHRDQRLVLAGVGQLASPLHSLWVFANIRAHLQQARCSFSQAILPRVMLHHLCSDLFDLRDRLFADKTPAMRMFQEHLQELLNPLPPAKPEGSRIINTYRSEPYIANWKCISTTSPHGHSTKEEESERCTALASDQQVEVSPTMPFEIVHQENAGKKIVPPLTGAVPGFAFHADLCAEPAASSSANASHMIAPIDAFSSENFAAEENPNGDSSMTDDVPPVPATNDRQDADSSSEDPPVPVPIDPPNEGLKSTNSETEMIPVIGYQSEMQVEPSHATESPPLVPWWLAKGCLMHKGF